MSGSSNTSQNRYVNMDIMINKIVRVLEVLVRERDHVHDLPVYQPSTNITERLDSLFDIVNTIDDDQSDQDTDAGTATDQLNALNGIIGTNGSVTNDTGVVMPSTLN